MQQNGLAEAYLLGLWIGDGAIHKNGSFFYVGDYMENEFEKAYQEWSGERIEPFRTGDKPIVGYWSRAWGDRLRELGYDWPCRAENKELKIVEDDPEWSLNLLSGLWQSDGTLLIKESYSNFRYGYCRSFKLCEQIIERLALFGIEGRLASTVSGGKKVWAVNVRKKHHGT